MDILKEQLNRSKELMGILNEQTEDETNELEEIVVYDETQEQVDGEGIQGLDEDAGMDTPGGNPDFFYGGGSLDKLRKFAEKQGETEMTKEAVIEELRAIYSYSQDGATELVNSALENLLDGLGGFESSIKENVNKRKI